MKFDELNVEQLEARKAELAGMDTEGVTTEELEARVAELEAINAELTARAEEAAKAEELRQQIAAENVKPIKEFKMEEKNMENRFAANSPEYREAFLKNLQGKELTAEERTALSSAAAVIPTQMMNEIIHKLERNPLLAAVDITNIPGYVTYPKETLVNDANWVDMGTAATDSTDTVGYFTLGAYKLIKTVEITADIDAMSIDAFETWLVDRLVNKIEKAIDAGIIAGGGSASGQCEGITKTKSTHDGTFTRAGITWKQLTAIMGKLASEYHPGASFVFNAEYFFKNVLGMVDSQNNRVVVLDPQAPRKYNILGYPCILDANAGTDDVFFGDFKAYKLNLAKGVEVRKSEEAEFRKGSAVYRAMTLADGNLGDLNAIVRCVATT